MTLHSHQRPKLQTPHASAQADEAPGAEPGDVVVVVRLQESLCKSLVDVPNGRKTPAASLVFGPSLRQLAVVLSH